jgi:hypothetical protein
MVYFHSVLRLHIVVLGHLLVYEHCRTKYQNRKCLNVTDNVYCTSNLSYFQNNKKMYCILYIMVSKKVFIFFMFS